MRHLALAAPLALALASPLAVAKPTLATEAATIGETDILYLDAAGWRAASPQRRLALSAAFMRIFCTDQRMPPERIAGCLDRDGQEGPIFERALACAAGSASAG